MKKIKNLTQEDYKELSQKLNSLKRENLHHPMEKSYIRKELAKILPIREGLILKFLSEVGILENTFTRTVDWTDENPIYVGKIKNALELFREYNLERNMSITEARKQKSFSVEDAINYCSKQESIKYIKEKSNGLKYDLFDLPRMVNEGSFPSLGTKGVVIIFFK